MTMKPDEASYSELARYVIENASMDPEDVMFIRLDGSAAEGNDQEFSDYDLVVVSRPGKKPEKRDFWGILNDRLVSFWVVSLEEYKELFCEVNENEFIWQLHSSRIAKCIFGDRNIFDSLTGSMRKKKWNSIIQGKAVAFSYGNVVEYMGKMLNTFSGRVGIHTFYFYAAQLANHYAQFIAALNRLNIRSLNTLHEQIFGAQHLPADFRNNFLILSGYSGTGRTRTSTLYAAREMVKWARNFLMNEYGLENFEDIEFREMVSKLRYQCSGVQ